MDHLPTVWGRHELALIEPLLVRDRLVTSVMREPDSWHQRLAQLGFRETNTCWLRVGALSPSEFAFLSPSIDLVSLRPEEVVDHVWQNDAEPDMPFIVQDALLRLWQKRPATLLMALSYEHNVNYTRGEAWSFVEAALEGDAGPEIDTLIGMTLTQMDMDGTLDQGVQLYADQIGWRAAGEVSPPASRGQLLFKAGQTIMWADKDGVVQQGRTAQRVCSADTGTWVYKENPRWVGGYPVAAQQWVERSQIQHTGIAYDWLPEHLVSHQGQVLQSGNDINAIPEAIPQAIVLSDEAFKALRNVVEGAFQFPVPAMHKGAMFGDLPAEVVAELDQLETSLEALSRHYHGDVPLNFTVVEGRVEGRHKSELVLSYSPAPYAELPYSGDNYHRVALIDTNDEVGHIIPLQHVARELEQARQVRHDELVACGEQAAAQLGLNSPVLPPGADRLIHTLASYDLLPALSTTERMLTAISALVRDPSRTLLQQPRAVATDSLAQRWDYDPKYNLPYGVTPSLISYLVPVVTIAQLGEALDSYAQHADRSRLVLEPTDYQLHRVFLDSDEQLHSLTNGAEVPGVDTKESPVIGQWHGTLDGAAKAYSTLIEHAYDRLTPGAKQLADMDRLLLSRLPLRDEFRDAMEQARAASDEQLAEHIKQQMAYQLKSKFSEIPEKLLPRCIDAITKELRKPDIQGVTFHMGKSRSTVRFYFSEVKYTDSALTQSRDATLTAAATNYKNQARIRATSGYVDAISLTNPDLCQRLANDGVAYAPELSGRAQNDGPTGRHEDTGVVAGFAMKDIRGFNRQELIAQSAQMNDQQKTKYLTRELIWPRRSMAELKEAGLDLRIAHAYETFWKGLPRKPKSNGHTHVNGFIEAITGMRDAVTPILAAHEGKGEDTTGERLRDYDTKVFQATQQVMADSSLASSVYTYRDRRIRGSGIDWGAFTVLNSYTYAKQTKELCWDDVIKRKAPTKAAAGSRVQRDAVKRTGEDYRKGVDVTGDDFLKTFMYSGVEFGNWTNQAERQKHLNFAYDSMMDFSRVMGWEPATLSLGGRLGLCIGSRGRGGSRAALAHFEPANMAINLTRMRGDGSLAHEYFHAVANHYGRIASGYDKDVNDLYGYNLQAKSSSPVPSVPANGLRDQLREATYNLLVAIMRQPKDEADLANIDAYTEPSAMLLRSLAEDGKKDYWASPREMFARAMEIWFAERMEEQGERNDYLVRAGKQGELYPDAEHMARINHYASRWLDAVQMQVQQVDHPYLGQVEMKVLYSNLEARAPLSRRELVEFCHAELDQLFGQFKPRLEVSQQLQVAGLYDLARDVVALRERHADEGTFYHEAWHACHNKLLTPTEQDGVDAFFASDSPGSALVLAAMERAGIHPAIQRDAAADPQEMAAYAFQLWRSGDLELTRADMAPFYQVRTYVDGVLEISGMFEPEDISNLFERFACGELAERKAASMSNGARNWVDEDWDAEDNLVWQLPAHEQEEQVTSSYGMRMG